jgi:excisionase family DNA binding protein
VSSPRSSIRPQTLKICEIARSLGISRATAYRAVLRGEIPAMRFGRRVVVSRSAFARFLERGVTPVVEKQGAGDASA